MSKKLPSFIDEGQMKSLLDELDFKMINWIA